MVGFLGGLCIIMSGCMVLWLRETDNRRREEVLCDMITVLRSMEEEIRYVRRPLPDLLAQAEKSCRRDGKAFFREIISALGRGGTLPLAWKAAAEQLPVSQEERYILLQLSDRFNNSEDSVCKTLQLSVKMLENSREAWKKKRGETEKMQKALWLSGAALLVILLI